MTSPIPKIIELTSYYGIIHVSGPDASTFLQGQLSCDVSRISSETVQLGGYCNLKGRLRALFKIIKQDDSYYLMLPIALAMSIFDELKKYARFSKVTLQLQSHDTETQWNIWGILGTVELDAIDVENDDRTIKSEQLICRTMLGTYPRLLLLINNSSTAAIEPPLFQNDGSGDLPEWLVHDIRQAIPEVYLETTEQFLPHYLNLPALGGVSFTKGCYRGQEIVARMQYLGKIKRGLTYNSFENTKDRIIPAPGSLFSMFNTNTNESHTQTATVISSVILNNTIELLIEKSI